MIDSVVAGFFVSGSLPVGLILSSVDLSRFLSLDCELSLILWVGRLFWSFESRFCLSVVFLVLSCEWGFARLVSFGATRCLVGFSRFVLADFFSVLAFSCSGFGAVVGGSEWSGSGG